MPLATGRGVPQHFGHLARAAVDRLLVHPYGAAVDPVAAL